MMQSACVYKCVHTEIQTTPKNKKLSLEQIQSLNLHKEQFCGHSVLQPWFESITYCPG